MSGRRPEHTGPPDLYYNETEARKYTSNSRIIEIQTKLAERALELLALPDSGPSFILDVGCGSGLSGEVLSDAGHYWLGMDISEHMLAVAVEREVDGELVLADVGDGLAFRPGMFDGVISISAIQWLCNADKRSHSPPKRLYAFFSTLYSAMAHGARAVFQLYPETGAQLELITQQAMRAGFTGGVVIDYPNSAKAKKLFLVLFAGGVSQALPKAKTGVEVSDEEEVDSDEEHAPKRARFESATTSNWKSRREPPVKYSREWIASKKDRARRKGKAVRNDSKYSGRKRKVKF